MGKSYGIEVCKNALEFLSSEKDIQTRTSNAISELEVLKFEARNGGDLSKDNSELLKEISQKLMSNNDDDIKFYIIISRQIVHICFDIIEENTKELSKQGDA